MSKRYNIGDFPCESIVGLKTFFTHCSFGWLKLDWTGWCKVFHSIQWFSYEYKPKNGTQEMPKLTAQHQQKPETSETNEEEEEVEEVEKKLCVQ